jgi:hypothetical protein
LPAIFVYLALISRYNIRMAQNGDTKSPGNTGSDLDFRAALWFATEMKNGHCACAKSKNDQKRLLS